MDSHQGTAFNFDMNMDFSNVFATKPIEDETSTSFFFGDEGIDTTTSIMDPILFPQQTAFDMQQGLTLDNTSGSTSVWNGQLTPQSQNALNTFPSTPTHSFDSLYQPQYGSALGKRPLQLDVQDFPQSKRHESLSDFTTGSLFSPLMPSTTASSWTLESQHTPTTSVEVGLSDEAADMCAMWFNKYAILPSDRHIDSLSQLTGESAEAIRHWFGRLMKQGMGSSHGDSAYRSQTALPQANRFWNEFSTSAIEVPQLPTEESTQESITTPEVTSAHDTVTVSQSANALRGGKKSRCTPTDDRSLLSRDSNKIYQCTRKCGKRYGRKCDWKRNEEEGYPCKSWVCSLCTSEGVENVKPCFRKYHFAQHFRNIHPGLNCDDFEEASIVCSETEFPRKCGFCKHRFESRQERIDHIADHFKQGKCMLDWNDNEDAHDSDNTDNDDDQPGDDDGSDDSSPASKPPQYDPRGGSGSKYYDGSGGFTDGGDSSDGGSQGGFFQFQLSQLNYGETGSHSPCADQHIKSTSYSQSSSRRTRCSSEPLQQQSKEDDSNALAGDALPRALAQHLVDISSQKNCRNYKSRNAEADALLDTKNGFLDAMIKSHQIMTVDSGIITSPDAAGTSKRQTADGRLRSLEACRATQTTPKPELGKMTAMLLDSAPGSETTPPPNLLPTGRWSTQATAAQAEAAQATVASELAALRTDSKVLQNVSTTSQSFLSVRFLGSGGFSTVDEVIHRETNLRLGRKTLKNRDPAAIKELWKEVNILQKLRHPHVIRYLGAYSKGDKMSMLLSPIADTTLALWLDRFLHKKPDNFSQVITKMLGCIASSVRYLHEQRPAITHGDIKPQNILIVEGDGEYPHVILADFGISSSEVTTDKLPLSGPLTRRYAAPEVFEGHPRKQAADIFSLGCVFIEMMSVIFNQDNSTWSSLRKEYSGRTGKSYGKDVSALQDRLAVLLENTATRAEQDGVCTLRTMLDPQPAKRPDAASLTLVFTPAPCCLSWPNDKVSYPGPREELDSVEMLVREDDADCQIHLHEHGEVATRTGQGRAKNWLQECSQSHEACSHAAPSSTKKLPRRLIDINPDGKDGSYIRLVDSASVSRDVESVEYIALSHVWDQSQTVLMTSNLIEMQANVNLHDLSPALSKAFTTARGLGYRFTWVDSLCVLQDCREDKLQECTSMASIFRNAALTLVLDQIDDGLELYKDKLPHSSENVDSGFGWDTRAWALQERLLSHRFLHLGQEQLYWECNSLKASETFPQGLPSLIWEKVHSKLDPADVDQHVSKIDKHATLTESKEQIPLGIHPVRNAQWVRKEGDGIGDSMEAAQTTLSVGTPIAIANTIAIGEMTTTHTHGTTTTPTRASDATASRLPAVEKVNASIQHDDSLVIDPFEKLWELAIDADTASARQGIEKSGQMDQNGSCKGVNGTSANEGDDMALFHADSGSKV